MRLAARRRRHSALVLAALCLISLAACAPPSVNSPEVDEMYKRMYGPIIDGG